MDIKHFTLLMLLIIISLFIILLTSKEEIKQPTNVIVEKQLKNNTFYGKNKNKTIDGLTKKIEIILIFTFFIVILLLHLIA